MEDDTKLRREIHAAIAMHALLEMSPVGQLAMPDRDEVDAAANADRIATVVKRAYQVADAMIEVGGPLDA